MGVNRGYGVKPLAGRSYGGGGCSLVGCRGPANCTRLTVKKFGVAAAERRYPAFRASSLRLLPFAAVLSGEGLDNAEASLIDAVGQLVNLAGEVVVAYDG